MVGMSAGLRACFLFSGARFAALEVLCGAVVVLAPICDAMHVLTG